MSTQQVIEEIILLIPFGPVAFVLVSALIFMLFLWIIQMGFSNGKKVSFLRGLREPFNRYILVIVFITFFVLATLAYGAGLGFDSPLLLLLALVLIIFFQGWEVVKIKRNTIIFVLAIAGALLGHNLAPMIFG